MGTGKYIVIAPVLSAPVRHRCEELKALIRGYLRKRNTAESVQFTSWKYAPNFWDEDRLEHVTVAPPFLANYEAASAINTSITLMELKHQRQEEVGLNCTLEVGKLGWFRNDVDILKLEVTNPLLARAASAIRKTITEEGSTAWVSPISDEINLHLTIASGKGLYGKLHDWVEQENRTSKRSHRVPVPCLLLLARYPEGWYMLSHDPSRQ